MREQRLQRNLKIVVIALGALILIGLGAIIARVLTLASGSGGKTSTAVTSVAHGPAGAGTVSLEIPRGSRIVSVSLSGSRLAVHHEGPAGAGISILDLDTGKRVVDVKPVEALPRD